MDLKYIVRESVIENPPLLIMLHGYGSNEQDLFSFAAELPKNLLIVSIQAPMSLGFGSYAWYSINFNDSENKYSNLEEANESIVKLEKFIEDIKIKFSVNSKKIFLLGFSQGAILSYSLALRNPSKIQYIIPMSGYINSELIPNDIKESSCESLDFFISHGLVDQVLPIDLVRKSLPILDQLKIKYSFFEYPIGHGINAQNFKDFKNWLEKRVSTFNL